MEPTGGSHLSFVEEKERVPFRDSTRWALGRFQIWAGMVPRGHFLFLFYFLLFFSCFLISFMYFAKKNQSSQTITITSFIFFDFPKIGKVRDVTRAFAPPPALPIQSGSIGGSATHTLNRNNKPT
jgi:hypothetical protein